ncbi:unnamed protein product [Lymnaea stagnalis]|uniref:Uncharacterized protein n=1 Tax=Lymnaea stagnalis TaxID=6523 RepID=A0AAV2HZM4_LYMST
MTSDLKVLRNESKDIYITDAKGNKIRQWLDIQDQNGYGVVELTFQLADNTPLGDWTIEVIMRGITESKTFSVENYVLPKFEVEVTPLAIALLYDPTLPVTVTAKYTFGKPVTKGRVDVLIQMSYNWYATRPSIKLSGQLNQDGQYQFEVSTKQLTDLVRTTVNYEGVSLQWYPIDIIANVTEQDTGRVQSSTKTVQYYESPLKINFLDISPSSFKPGLTYAGYIEIKKQDDTPFTPTEFSKMRVRVNVTYEVPLTEKELEEQRKQYATEDTVDEANSTSSNSTTLTQAKYIRPPYFWYPQTKTLVMELAQPLLTPTEQGWITVSFDVPLAASSVNIEARCLEPFENEVTYKYVKKMMSPTNSFLQLKAPTVKPKIGDSVTIRAEATDVITTLTCQIYSKGQLALSDVKTAPAGSKTVDYTFTITQAMSLKVNIICFYIRDENSEFVVDAVAIGVDGLFEKPVTIQFNETTVKPGQEVKVTLKGEPESIFFTGANDKSVLLLKSGHDITTDRVQEELMEYDGFGGGIGWRYMFMCGWPSYISGENAADVFNGVSVIVLSDGLISNERPVYNRGRGDDRVMYMNEAAPGAPEASGAKGGGAQSTLPPVKVRKFFPETWLWDLKISNSNGQVEYTVTAPDTITSFVATAFSVHPTYGLSVAKDPAVVTVFRDLFISLDTASSIIKGEDYCFKCTVFSYYKGELPVLLTLDKSDSFSNIHVKRDGDQILLAKESLSYSYFLGYLEENDIVTSTFCVTLNVIGDITIKMSALTNVPGLSDALEQNITVKPEGVPRTTSRAFLVDLSSGVWNQTVPISFPAAAVEGSQSIVVNCAGSMLGPQIKNFRDLLRMPYGCGEQNMLNFAPNIFLTKLMLVLNKTFSDVLEQAKEFMLIGYQKEIMYEHQSTGGFSTFGCHKDACDNASLWLTAFITKCFSQAKQLYAIYPDGMDVDSSILQRSITFMLKQQNENGSFTEHGRVFHKEMQGGSAEGEALTAYTLIALYEADKAVGNNSSTAVSVGTITDGIRQGEKFLRSRLPYLTDPYDICLVAYTLHLINSQGKDEIFNKMERIAINGDGLKYWKRPTKVQTDVYSWSASAESISIEATSYALLTYALRNTESTEGLPIVRWLSQNRGPNGGFISTQDTVIGLQALSTVVAKLYSNLDIPMTISVSHEKSDGQTTVEQFHVNKANELLLQSIYIDFKNNAPKSVSIKAVTDDGRQGPSAIVTEVVMYYNIKDETKAQVYDMDYQLVTQGNNIELTVIIRTKSTEESSMTILEVELFPSYSPDTDVLTANKNISLVEISGDKLNLYFNAGGINTSGVTVKIPMAQTSGVLAKALSRSIRVYNYYNPSEEVTKTYSLEAQPNFCKAVGDYGVCGIGQA